MGWILFFVFKRIFSNIKIWKDLCPKYIRKSLKFVCWEEDDGWRLFRIVVGFISPQNIFKIVIWMLPLIVIWNLPSFLRNRICMVFPNICCEPETPHAFVLYNLWTVTYVFENCNFEDLWMSKLWPEEFIFEKLYFEKLKIFLSVKFYWSDP